MAPVVVSLLKQTLGSIFSRVLKTKRGLCGDAGEDELGNCCYIAVTCFFFPSSDQNLLKKKKLKNVLLCLYVPFELC